jgi:exodeoxyribonuclease-3
MRTGKELPRNKIRVIRESAAKVRIVRIATWNVNSLKARLEKVTWWLDRAKPDILLMQETKLADDDAPHELFTNVGYELAHHGEGRWNGVAIASRRGLTDIVTNFGQPLRPAETPNVGDDEPLAEARMISAVCGGVRIVSIYAPNGRSVDSIFYQAKLLWFAQLARWLAEFADPSQPLAIGGDFNVAPEDNDVWIHEFVTAGRMCRLWNARHSENSALGTGRCYRLHHPEAERYTWWDYRAGNFHKNFGMRIDHLLVSQPLAQRVVWAEIDREARKGKPIPSDHAPLVIDLDEAGILSTRAGSPPKAASQRGGSNANEGRKYSPFRQIANILHSDIVGIGVSRERSAEILPFSSRAGTRGWADAKRRSHAYVTTNSHTASGSSGRPRVRRLSTSGTGASSRSVDQEPQHKVVLKNDFVRIIDATLPPGYVTLNHTHAVDNVSVTVANGREGEAGSEAWAEPAFPKVDIRIL